MILTNGKMKVLKNKNKRTQFFKDIVEGDVIEILLNVDFSIGSGCSTELTTIKNHTQGTQKTDSPKHIRLGMDKISSEHITGPSQGDVFRGSSIRDVFNGKETMWSVLNFQVK